MSKIKVFFPIAVLQENEEPLLNTLPLSLRQPCGVRGWGWEGGGGNRSGGVLNELIE